MAGSGCLKHFFKKKKNIISSLCFFILSLVCSPDLFSCLVSPLPSSPLSLSLSSSSVSLALSSFSVSLSLRVMLCVMLCCVGVCCAVFVCGVVWHAENLRVDIQNVPVYAGNTRTCFLTCARGAGIHGDLLNGHTEGRAVSSSVLLTKKSPRRVITWPQRSTKETNGSYPFQFENRPRATRCRFLQSFAFPDKAVQLQQS